MWLVIIWPQKLVLHPTPSIIMVKIDEHTSLSFYFAAKKYRFIFCLHRMLNSVRTWRLREDVHVYACVREKEHKKNYREKEGRRKRENSRVFSIFFFIPEMSRKILICGFTTVDSFLSVYKVVYGVRVHVYVGWSVEFPDHICTNTRSITIYYYSCRQPFWCICALLF